MTTETRVQSGSIPEMLPRKGQDIEAISFDVVGPEQTAAETVALAEDHTSRREVEGFE